MIAFLYDDVADLLRCLLRCLVKQSILKAADNSYKLIKVEFPSKDVLLSYQDVDIGVAAVKALACSKSSDLIKMQFRNDCMAFMKAATQKIIERSPMKYIMVRTNNYTVCMDSMH